MQYPGWGTYQLPQDVIKQLCVITQEKSAVRKKARGGDNRFPSYNFPISIFCGKFDHVTRPVGRQIGLPLDRASNILRGISRNSSSIPLLSALSAYLFLIGFLVIYLGTRCRQRDWLRRRCCWRRRHRRWPLRRRRRWSVWATATPTATIRRLRQIRSSSAIPSSWRTASRVYRCRRVAPTPRRRRYGISLSFSLFKFVRHRFHLTFSNSYS